MNIEIKTQEQVEQEMMDLNNQFNEFLNTKGILQKFRLAFANIGDSAKNQKELDRAHLAEIKQKSAKENADFVKFLHTKGFKAKCKLIIENIKTGAKESSKNTADNIAKAHANAKANVNTYKKDYTAEELSKEFNAFLKAKGLSDEYVVTVNEQ